MTTKLWAHQRAGANWLKARSRAYLGDRPRVGKTLTLATAAKETGAQHVMVISPAIVRSHWRETFGETNYAGKLSVFSYSEIVNGGETMREGLLGQGSPDVAILDESHALKTMTAQRTRLILGRDGYARRIPVVWAASGTPVPRHPGEFYAIAATMFPRVMLAHGIQQYADFEARFLIQRRAFARGTTHMKVVGIRGEAEFRAILDDVMLQRTLDDIGADQPKLIWEVLPLDGESAAVKEATAKLPGLNSYENASHVRKLVGEAKAAVVAKMVVGQLRESDEKLVVFAHHTSVLERLAGALREANIQFSFVDGSVTPKKRDVALTEFRDNPKVQVFLAQNVACMAGIDLSAAASLLLIEPGWVASDNDQLGHRILGPNQKSRHVVAQMISLAGTIDDSIVRQNVREAQIQDRLFRRDT